MQLLSPKKEIIKWRVVCLVLITNLIKNLILSRGLKMKRMIKDVKYTKDF